jgi:hypothetical protein
MSKRQYSPPKLVFPHVPKTAGTSVIHWLQQHYRYDEVLREASIWLQLFEKPMEHWADKRFVRGHFGSRIVRYFRREDGFHRITALRDPVERALSQFWHYKRVPDFPPRLVFVRDDNYTIEQFIEDPRTRMFVRNFQVFQLGFDLARDLKPDDIYDLMRKGEETSDAQLKRAVTFLESCDVVGTTELLGRFVAGLATLLGAPPAQSLGRERSYRPAGFEAAPDLRAKIRRMNEADYELYGVARALAEKQERSRTRLVVRLMRSITSGRNPLTLASNQRCCWRVDEPFFGSGWSDLNSRPGGDTPVHRWTIGQGPATIRVRLRRRKQYEIRIAALRFVSSTQLDGFRVTIDGCAVAWQMEPWSEARAPGGGYFIANFATRSVRDVEIALIVETPLAFSESVDRVKRGVAVAAIEIGERQPGAGMSSDMAASPRKTEGALQPADSQ